MASHHNYSSAESFNWNTIHNRKVEFHLRTRETQFISPQQYAHSNTYLRIIFVIPRIFVKIFWCKFKLSQMQLIFIWVQWIRDISIFLSCIFPKVSKQSHHNFKTSALIFIFNTCPERFYLVTMVTMNSYTVRQKGKYP